MKSNLRRRLILTLVLLSAGAFLTNVLPQLWFEWRLNQNTSPGTASAAQNNGFQKICLVFALDGVPYSIMADLVDQGYFKNFYKPGRLISTFPSLTLPAFSKLLIGGKPFGYERLYFNANANKIEGNSLAEKIFSSNAQAPDYHPRLDFLGFPGYIAYVFPDQFTQTAIDTFKKKLLGFQGKEFIAYMGFSDAIAHVQGRKAQIEFLKKISRLLDNVKHEMGPVLDIVAFSDHGNNFIENTRVDLAKELEKSGMNDADQLENQNDFILLKNGFVSAAAIYAYPEQARPIAEILSRVKGVDFSTYVSGNSIMVGGPDGIAAIRHKNNRFAYTPVTGDPLKLSQFLIKFNLNGTFDAQGYAPDIEWWQATKRHIYPDPLYRIWQAHHDLVQYPATLLVSFKDGYAFGPAFFDQNLVAARKSTHGALLDKHSYGFFMTDFKPVDDVSRPQVIANLLANSAQVKETGESLTHLNNGSVHKK